MLHIHIYYSTVTCIYMYCTCILHKMHSTPSQVQYMYIQLMSSLINIVGSYDAYKYKCFIHTAAMMCCSHAAIITPPQCDSSMCNITCWGYGGGIAWTVNRSQVPYKGMKVVGIGFNFSTLGIPDPAMNNNSIITCGEIDPTDLLVSTSSILFIFEGTHVHLCTCTHINTLEVLFTSCRVHVVYVYLFICCISACNGLQKHLIFLYLFM